MAAGTQEPKLEPKIETENEVVSATQSWPKVPSLRDKTLLDCCIHYPPKWGDELHRDSEAHQGPKGAILGPPYARMGGTYKDPTIKTVASILVSRGYTVMTFNFRGAGRSEGHTSFYGRAEIDDFLSVFGFFLYFLHNITPPVHPMAERGNGGQDSSRTNEHPIHMILGGYSYGSLVLAQLPHVSEMIERFASAEEGSPEANIRTLGRQHAEELQRFLTNSVNKEPPPSPTFNPYLRAARKTANNRTASTPRQKDADKTTVAPPHGERNSPITTGNANTNPSAHRRSGELRHSLDRIFHGSPGKSHHTSGDGKAVELPTTARTTNEIGPQVRPAYIVISPVLLPYSTTMMTPGLPSVEQMWNPPGRVGNPKSGLLSVTCPTFAVFGTKDVFTKASKLQQWAARLKAISPNFHGVEIEHASHWWEEDEYRRQLKTKLRCWLDNDLIVAR